MYAVLVFAFTSFFIYEQYEDELDQAFRLTVIVAKSLLILLLRSLPLSITSSFSADDDIGQEHGRPALKE